MSSRQAQCSTSIPSAVFYTGPGALVGGVQTMNVGPFTYFNLFVAGPAANSGSPTTYKIPAEGLTTKGDLIVQSGILDLGPGTGSPGSIVVEGGDFLAATAGASLVQLSSTPGPLVVMENKRPGAVTTNAIGGAGRHGPALPRIGPRVAHAHRRRCGNRHGHRADACRRAQERPRRNAQPRTHAERAGPLGNALLECQPAAARAHPR